MALTIRPPEFYLTGRHYWLQQLLANAPVSLDFETSTYDADGETVLSNIITTTRSTAALAVDSADLWTSVSANTLRVTDLGDLIEEASSNKIRTNNFADATSGAIATNGIELITNGQMLTDLTGWTDKSTGTGTATAAVPGVLLRGGASGIGAIEQSFSVVSGQKYTLQWTSDVNVVGVTIGTTSGGRNIYDSILGIAYRAIVFTAAANQTWYLRFYNASNVDAYIYTVSAQRQSLPVYQAGTGSATGLLSGLTRGWFTITGVGTVDGLSYMSIRFQTVASGAPITTGISLALESTSQVPASNGQVWTISSWIAMIAGSTTGIRNILFQLIERGTTTVAHVATSIRSQLTSALQRYSYTATLTGLASTTIQPLFSIITDPGAAIDITLQFQGWQLEQLPYTTSPIITTDAAANRAADVCKETLAGVANGTLIAYATAADNNGTLQTLLSWDGGGDRISIYRDVDTTIRFQTVHDSVVQGTIDLGTVDDGDSIQLCCSWGVHGLVGSLNGDLPVIASAGTIPSSLTVLTHGADGTNANYFNSFTQYVGLLRAETDPDTCQVISAGP